MHVLSFTFPLCTLAETLLLELAMIHLELKMKQITLVLVYVWS